MSNYVDGSLVFDTKLNTDGVLGGLEKMKKVALKSTAAIGSAFAAVTTLSLKSLGELEQNIGGAQAVFERYAQDIQNKAGEAYKNMGLSASNYLATANKMGALLKGSGFEVKEAADTASKAMQRAADVASVMGIDVGVAMESVAGAAKGNFTMMDNLGVAMNDTTLNAYALEKGLGKTTQQMTNQEKVALALEMFLDRTAYAAGRYAEENDTLSGSLNTAKAALENFLSGAGTADELVESFKNAADVIAENLKELIPALGEGLSEALKQIIPMVPQFIEENAGEFAAGSAGLIAALAEGVIEGVPTLVSAAAEAISIFAAEIGKAMPILNPITSLVGFLGDNFEILGPAILAAVVAVKAYNLIMGAHKAITTACTAAKQVLIAHENAHRLSLVALNGGLTLTQTAVGVLTGKISLATAATGLWSKALTFLTSSTGIGLVISLVAALVAGLGAYAATSGDASSSTANLSKELDDLAESYQNAKKSAEDSMQSELAKLSLAESTIPRLEELANNTNRTAEEDLELKDIISDLNEVMPELRLAIDDETGALTRNIDEVERAIIAYRALAKAKAAGNILVKAEENALTAQKIIDDNEKSWTARGAHKFQTTGNQYLDEIKAAFLGEQDARNAQTERAKAQLEVRRANADVEYWKKIQSEAQEEYNKIAAELGFGKESDGTGGGGTGGGGTGGRASRAKEYKKAVEEEIAAEERKFSILKQRGLVSQKDYLSNIAYRAEMYRKYAEDALKQDGLSVEERQAIYEEWIEKAEELEAEYLTAHLKIDKEALDEQRARGEISQQEYWKKLGELRDKYFTEGSDAWLAYSEEIVELQKKEIEKTYTEIANAAESSFKDIERAQNSLENKLKGFGGIFKTITLKGTGIGGSDESYLALRDFEKDNEALVKYQGALETLKERGKEILGDDFSAFFRQFSEMSVEEGTEAVNALLGASDEDFKRSLSGWKEYQRNSEKFAAEFYQDDYEILKEKTLEELRQAFDDVPDTFIENGKLVADAFGEGFIERIETVFDEISLAINRELAQIAPQLSVTSGGAASGATTYHTVYQFASSGETVAQQLQTAAAVAMREKLRGK